MSFEPSQGGNSAIFHLGDKNDVVGHMGLHYPEKLTVTTLRHVAKELGIKIKPGSTHIEVIRAILETTGIGSGAGRCSGQGVQADRSESCEAQGQKHQTLTALMPMRPMKRAQMVTTTMNKQSNWRKTSPRSCPI